MNIHRVEFEEYKFQWNASAKVSNYLVLLFQVSVEAALEHPFFIIGQGWSSASPQHTLLRYRLPCHQVKAIPFLAV